MKMGTEDYLKKALLDTQERIRDFMNYSQQAKSEEMQQFFRDYAKSEGLQAQKMQQYLEDMAHPH